ncbi:hypothetical protein J437_LFUL015039 [Ladona fulva]|uniref:Uncharacterized protein n=1 Tax=Ladona fulva TaxID=123851 RepID=A0A8K0P9L3_LADFU|nr:hypothetical protein J437_LFUL015039 [Ladona fulva]
MIPLAAATPSHLLCGEALQGRKFCTFLLCLINTGKLKAIVQLSSSCLRGYISTSLGDGIKRLPIFDIFCYVCRQFIKTRAMKYSMEATTKMCKAHKVHLASLPVFKTNPGHFISPGSTVKYSGRKEKGAMKFAIQRIWHSSDFYYCMVNPSNCWTGKNAFTITCPDLSSSIAPVPHCHEFSVLFSLKRTESKDDIADENFRGAEERNPNQKDLNDLIRVSLSPMLSF